MINLKYYRLSIFIYLFIIYSLYFFLDLNTMISLGKEDGLMEYITFFCFLSASFIFFRTYLVNKNIFFLLLSLVFIFGAGEEISWGQRIFSFTTPESIKEINVQKEFNIHNIEIFNENNFDRSSKEGWAKLLTISFLYKLFWLTFGIILPIIVRFRKVTPLIMRFKLPVPPLSLGLFFMVNWITFKIIILYYIIPADYPIPYINTIGEVFESGSAFIFLFISYYFFKTERLN